MIYLIGGPPRCGKSTIAQLLANKIKIPILPANYLRIMVCPFLKYEDKRKKFPLDYVKKNAEWINDVIYNKFTPHKLVQYYQKQAKSIWTSLQACLKQALLSNDNLIIEGHQIQPDLLYKFLVRYPQFAQNIRVVFLYQRNINDILREIKQGNSEQNWALRNTKKEETYLKIAEMISIYGERIYRQTQKYNFASFNTELHFKRQAKNIVNHLLSNFYYTIPAKISIITSIFINKFYNKKSAHIN